jgi:hypothetical protein
MNVDLLMVKAVFGNEGEILGKSIEILMTNIIMKTPKKKKPQGEKIVSKVFNLKLSEKYAN